MLFGWSKLLISFSSFLSYLLTIESVADVKEYLFQLLDPDDKNVQQLVQQICLNWPNAKSSKFPKNDERNERVGSGLRLGKFG
jgi:hypothetical protein